MLRLTSILTVALVLSSCAKSATTGNDDDDVDASVGAADASGGSDADPGAADVDEDGYPAATDCDDNDKDVNPGADEVCDGVDNDCDGTIDGDAAIDRPTWYRDVDLDGYGVDTDVLVQCDQPSGYESESGDCNDGDPNFYPGAPEDDCADPNDYNCDGETGYVDFDEDSYAACEDCNDTNPAINPGMAESCNGIDDNCSGTPDDDTILNMCGAVLNGSASCEGAGGCAIASCDAEYFDVDLEYATGCECLSTPAVALGTTCEEAIDLGDHIDADATTTAVLGKTATPARAIWYKFNAIDDADTNGDEFHVDVRFASNPNDAYRFDVIRGDCATAASAVTEDHFSWFTNFARTSTGCTISAPCGEGDCRMPAQAGFNTCNDDSAVYYVRVFRSDAAPSCDEFQLDISNGVY